MTDTLDISDLRTDFIEAEPRHFDFSEGYPERWDFSEAIECEECGATIVMGNEDEHGPWSEDDRMPCPRNHLSMHEMGAEGPMMNTLYPLDGGTAFDASAKLVDLPLCLIYDEDENEVIGMALTGGGMDLSWEIAEAYVRLGFYPPVTIRPPAMCGRGSDAYSDESRERDMAIITACVQGATIVKGWMDSRIAELQRVRDWKND